MRSIHSFIVVLIVSFCTSLFAQQVQKPVPAINHAIIISVDGMRPDLALRANMPTLRSRMIERGAFSFWARSTEVSITLPTHTSMLTGVPPEEHGIFFNNDGPEEPVHPKVPSIFEYAKKAGYTTAMATGKSKMRVIPLPESIDYDHVPPRGSGANNLKVAETAASIIKEHRPGLLFVHFGDTDGRGHHIGWGTPEQIEAFEVTDKCLGMIFDALEEQNLLDSTVVILMADHGGRQRWHGKNDPRARLIPWIIVGPGIKAGLDLDSVREHQVNVEDTFATACTLLGIQTDKVFGQTVWEAIETQPAAEANQGEAK